MKISVDINHPGQVHFFKNFISNMVERNHEILITASQKDITYELLSKYGFDYERLGSYGDSVVKKLINVPLKDYEMLKAAKRFKASLFVGFGSIRSAHVSKLMRRPCINFDDDEYSYPYYNQFADAICGFAGFKISGSKIIKLNSYKELGYLHPNYFKPNRETLNELGISNDEEYTVLRFVGWNAYHDVGKHGFDLAHKRRLVKELSKHADVFISSESPLPKDLVRYRLEISPEKMHDILFFAKLLVSDSQTMTTEAGVLGTPAIRCNSFVGENDMNNFVQLEKTYGLVYNHKDPDKATSKALELIQRQDLKREWEEKRKKLLRDTIDPTSFMIWFIENYPLSFHKAKEKQSNLEEIYKYAA